jgi:uncharacterized membrane protein YphA (DoxX/SURF4 family)
MSSRRGAVLLVFRLACRLVPAGLLLWGGLAKAFDRQSAILAVGAYDLLPNRLAEIVGTLLPWAEIAVGLLLILGLFVRFAAIATAVLAGVFIAGMAQAKARGLAISCGCFGGSGVGEGVSWWDILRDVPILLAGLYLAWKPQGPWQLDNRFLPGDDDGQRIETDQEGDEAGEPALPR